MATTSARPVPAAAPKIAELTIIIPSLRNGLEKVPE